MKGFKKLLSVVLILVLSLVATVSSAACNLSELKFDIINTTTKTETTVPEDDEKENSEPQNPTDEENDDEETEIATTLPDNVRFYQYVEQFDAAQSTLKLDVTSAEMPATMIRLNLIKGLGPVLQIAEGWTVKLPDEVTDKLWKRTDYTWPCTWFTPRITGKNGFKSAYDLMNNWGANHGAISYGHIGADLITMCSMLRIPVCLHNVDEDKIYRPAAWNAFGMDKEGQDYRACAAYGPLYKNIR